MIVNVFMIIISAYCTALTALDILLRSKVSLENIDVVAHHVQ